MRVRNLGALIVVAGLGCGRGSPDAAEIARISEWQLMVASARESGALTALRSRAIGGMLVAQSALGRALSTQSEPELRIEGLRWLRRAADRGDAQALLALGKLELVGSPDVSIDYSAARKCFLASSVKGEARADYYLALMDKNGYGSSVDLASAARHLDVAARHDIPVAQFLLANAYRYGMGVAKDESRALTLYEEAADKGLPEALQTLAMVFRDGELGQIADRERAQSALEDLEDALHHPPPPP